MAAHLFHKHVLSQVPLLNAVGQVFACTAGGIPGCIGFSVHSAYAQTGSFQMALKAGAFAGITAAAFNAVGAGPFGYGVGDGPAQLALNALASGFVGGVLHELQGGKFGHGFLSAGVSAFAKPAIRHAFGTTAAGRPYRIAARAAIGGTLSAATGGKFVNGAITAAFSQAYNEERTLKEDTARHSRRGSKIRGRPLTEEEKATFADYYSTETLESARIYDGRVPWWLRKNMDAVTRGNKIFIREGAYVPGTARAVQLLGHELAHVEQYANGMNVFTYALANRRSYRNNRYEVEARAKAEEIRVDYCSSKLGAAGC